MRECTSKISFAAPSVPFIYTLEQSLSAIIMKNQRYVILLTISTLAIIINSAIWIAGSGISAFAQNITGTPPSGTNLNQTSFINENDRPLSLIIDHAGGSFTSLQTDRDNKTWIATGNWELESEPSIDNQSNSSVVNFNATIGMRGTDNSAGHEHKISEFKLANSFDSKR